MVTKPVQSQAADVAAAAVPAKAPAAKKVLPSQPKLAKPAIKKSVANAKPKVIANKVAKPTVAKVAAAKPAKAKPEAVKLKKPKLVRDSFTMPKDEYAVVHSLKTRSGKLGQSVKKSELLRAGIKVLANLSDIQFKAALSDVPTLKTGRPKKG
jgi:hypothetical protein